MIIYLHCSGTNYLLLSFRGSPAAATTKAVLTLETGDGNAFLYVLYYINHCAKRNVCMGDF